MPLTTIAERLACQVCRKGSPWIMTGRTCGDCLTMPFKARKRLYPQRLKGPPVKAG